MNTGNFPFEIISSKSSGNSFVPICFSIKCPHPLTSINLTLSFLTNKSAESSILFLSLSDTKAIISSTLALTSSFISKSYNSFNFNDFNSSSRTTEGVTKINFLTFFFVSPNQRTKKAPPQLCPIKIEFSLTGNLLNSFFQSS